MARRIFTDQADTLAPSTKRRAVFVFGETHDG